jgi:hypothetical protein
MLRRCHVGSKFERSPADPLQSGFSLFRKEKRPQEAFRGEIDHSGERLIGCIECNR